MVGRLMDAVEANYDEKELEAEGYAEDIAINEEGIEAKNVTEISNKLHNVLLNLSSGEANVVVRRCQSHNGLLAWKRLHEKLNPRTLASGVKAISQVLSPMKITSASKADSSIEAWEEKTKKLSIEYGETLSNLSLIHI